MKEKLVPWKKRSPGRMSGRDENPFDLLHREIDELFDAYFRGGGSRGMRFSASPGFEVSETDDEIRVKAELPGVDEKDIEVVLDADVLTVRAERREQHEEKRRNYHVSEMSHGRFIRTFPLQAAVDRSKVEARFKDGMLTLRLPKTEQAKAERKRISIRAG